MTDIIPQARLEHLIGVYKRGEKMSYAMLYEMSDGLLAERAAVAGIVEQLREAMNEVEYANGGSVTRSEKLAKIARILAAEKKDVGNG